MPNKQPRPVGVEPFAAKGLMPEGLLPVARGSGEADSEIASSADHLASVLNRYADEAATIEGKAAGKAAGNDPNFRPSGSTSLKGRAFDEAATETYTQNLDAKLRLKLQDTYEANKDDPVKLKAAYEQLHTDMHAADVFPEIQGKFTKQFTELSIAYRNKAQSNFDDLQKDADKTSLFQNLSVVDTATRRAITTLDPDDPAIEGIVAGAVKQQAALYKKAADSEAISQAAAALKTQGMRNSLWGDVVLSRAGKLTDPDALAAYSRTFEADFAAGKYEGKLDGAGFEQVRANLGKLGKAVSTGATQAVNTLQSGFEDFIKRDTSGMKPPEAEWNALVAAAKNVPQGDQLVAMADAKRKLAATLSASSVDAGDAIVQRLREEGRAAGGIEPFRASLIAFGEKFIKEERQAFNQDQLGAAQRKGIVNAIAPLDFEGFAKSNDPGAADALAAQIRDRTAQARAVGGSLSRAPQYLRPEEKARLTEIVAEGGDKALALAGAIVRGAGTDAPAVLKQISDDAPLLAQAGNIIVNGGSLQAARDAFEANRLKSIKGSRVPEPDNASFNKTLRDELGQAYVMQPEDQGRVRAAATAIAEARLARGAIDPKGSGAADIYKKAVQEAAGAQFIDGVQYGGTTAYKPGWWTSYRVPVPNAVRADSFRYVLRAITDDDLKQIGAPANFKARDFTDAVPVAVRGGYRFAQGDPSSADPKYIGANGVPYVLDLDALTPRLRMRVPGAFIGGR